MSESHSKRKASRNEEKSMNRKKESMRNHYSYLVNNESKSKDIIGRNNSDLREIKEGEQ